MSDVSPLDHIQDFPRVDFSAFVKHYSELDKVFNGPGDILFDENYHR